MIHEFTKTLGSELGLWSAYKLQIVSTVLYRCENKQFKLKLNLKIKTNTLTIAVG